MSAEDVSELTFRFQDRRDGSVKVLPMSHEVLEDPKFTIGILNTAICDDPEIVRFKPVVRTHTLHRLLHYAIQGDREFACKISVRELIRMTDADLQRSGLGRKHLEIFRLATQAIREKFIERTTTQPHQ